MLASDVIDAAAIELGDSDGDRWTSTKLVGHLNSALDALILWRPDAFAALSTVKLDKGSVQSIPETAARFLGAVRNMGKDGTTVGRVIRNGDMDAMDAFDPDWMSSQPAAAVKEVFFNEAVPDKFYCYPPANDDAGSTPVYIQIRTADYHTRITATTDTVAVNTRFRVPLMYLVMSFAYHENTDVGSKQLAAQYEQQAKALVVDGIKVDAAQPPKIKQDPA